MSNDILDRRSRIRAKTLGSATTYKQIGLEVDGEYIAVREPTVKERADILKEASGDLGNGKFDFNLATQQVVAVVACAFVAEPVMEPDPDASADEVQAGQAAAAPKLRVKTERLPVLDFQGNPMLEAVLDADGKPVIGQDGEPLQQEKFTTCPVVTSGFTKPERIYENSDLAVLFVKPVSGFMNALIPAAMRLFNPKEEDARKSR